jgi:adenine-specific DNA-methyltransferase
MTVRLKPAILEQMGRDELKSVCDTLELEEVDRRSADDMRRTLSRKGRARPELLLETLSEAQVKAVCDAMGLEPTGRRSALIERLLARAQEGGDDGDELASTGGRKSPPTLDDLRAIASPRKRGEKRVTRYLYDQFSDPATPETGHTALMPAEETEVTLPMDNGWSKAIEVGKLPESGRSVVVDMDPSADPVLFWAGKRHRRQVPVLPLQRNEVVSESRIAQVIDRTRRRAAQKDGTPAQASFAFADLERSLRDKGKDHRVEFYTYDEGWKNKLICGDSLHVIESLLHYENLRGKVQMIYIDPPFGIKYDSNFQQQVDSTENDQADTADDVITIKAFRDTWSLGVHSYLSYLQERLYLCRELLAVTGSVFVQIGDKNQHLIRALLDEVFGAENFVVQIYLKKTPHHEGSLLEAINDHILWYAKDKTQVKYRPLYKPWSYWDADLEKFSNIELLDGTVRKLTREEKENPNLIPAGGRLFRADVTMTQDGETSEGQVPFVFEGKTYYPGTGRHWRVAEKGRKRLVELSRLVHGKERPFFKLYYDDSPVTVRTNIWDDLTGAQHKVYVVQTNQRAVARCLLMTTDRGDLAFDPTCGSGTTALVAEQFGRRWITCDTSRVATNVARKRLLAAVLDLYLTRNGGVSGDFRYKSVESSTLSTLAYDREPERIELHDSPIPDKAAIRVCGPFEVMSLGRYSVEDWKGYVVREPGVGEAAKLENYIDVICRLYRKEAAVQGGSGLVHAIAESGKERIGISVGPLTGRVTARQVNDAVQDALASGLLEVHVLGWAFEANVGEVKAQLEKRGRVKIELIMIRPDTLAEGLKSSNREMLFSPLALPDIAVEVSKNNGKEKHMVVRLSGVALFNRKTHKTEYRAADSGYISAWYLDEDYDGDCFVDCQMFFDFKKTPNIKATLKVDVDPEEWKLQTESQPFPMRGYRRIAVKVVDVYGNESTVVRELR